MKNLPVRLAFAAATVVTISACVADPGLYVDTMKGVGSARTMPDGSSGFTFAINENAYDGIIDRADTAKLRAQHDYIIASWVGSSGTCPRGYTVLPPRTIKGVVMYEGRCN